MPLRNGLALLFGIESIFLPAAHLRASNAAPGAVNTGFARYFAIAWVAAATPSERGIGSRQAGGPEAGGGGEHRDAAPQPAQAGGPEGRTRRGRSRCDHGGISQGAAPAAKTFAAACTDIVSRPATGTRKAARRTPRRAARIQYRRGQWRPPGADAAAAGPRRAGGVDGRPSPGAGIRPRFGPCRRTPAGGGPPARPRPPAAAPPARAPTTTRPGRPVR